MAVPKCQQECQQPQPVFAPSKGIPNRAQSGGVQDGGRGGGEGPESDAPIVRQRVQQAALLAILCPCSCATPIMQK